MHIVIFTGYNQRAILAFIRTLDRQNIDFSIVAKHCDDEIFLTKYSKNIIAQRCKKELDLNDIETCLKKIKKTKNVNKLLIIPSTEALNRFLLENRTFFQNLNCKIPLIDKNTYELISDKLTFTELCKKNNINIPQNIECKIENIPFVAKPKKYFNKNNEIFSPVLILNKADYKDFTKKYDLSNFYYQEYVEGESYYLLYYFSKNGEIIKFSQKNLVQQSEGKSIVASIPSTIHDSFVSKKYEILFKELKFFGLIMIELRKSKDRFYMIEANPRFWGPSQLFVDAGLNFFEYFLQDNDINIAISDQNINKNAKYFWNGGFDKNVVYFGLNKTDFFNEYIDFFKYEIYNRLDSIEIFQKECCKKLEDNYLNISKHSNYQILTKDLQKYIPIEKLNIKSRSEEARLDYILKNVDVKNKSIIDIGANTGYFSFELLKQGAEDVTCFEGNPEHSLFIQDSANILKVFNKMTMYNEYYNFDKINQYSKKYDVMLLLNVLHHIGDDYGDKMLNIENAKNMIINQLNKCAMVTKLLVFQLGFNWKGDRNSCLFANGEKKELIDYIKKETIDYWDIQKIGIAEDNCGIILYKDLSGKNIIRQDSLGEFLNRPIFIMESKVLCKHEKMGKKRLYI